MPWRHIITPKIPGTDIEIGFIEYDPDPRDIVKRYLIPNADQNGINGIRSVKFCLPLTENVRAYIKTLFPRAKDENDRVEIPLIGGELVFKSAEKVIIELKVDASSQQFQGNQFSLENVFVRT